MKEVRLTWQDIEKQVQTIARRILLDGFRPDYVVGIVRGGLIPATMLSQYLNVPLNTLKVSFRDDTDTESNLWMAEDAFGYNPETFRPDIAFRKNILIVDDINDSGRTLNWIKKDWEGACNPTPKSEWDSVWGKTVRTAVLYDNETSGSQIDINYSAVDVNKLTDPQWISFPWEEWWSN